MNRLLLRRLFPLLKKSFAKWKADNAMRLAASLAYYTAFSLAPLLLAAIAVGGMLFGQDAAGDRIFLQLRGTLGPTVAQSIQDLVQAARKPAQGVMGIVGAFAMVLYGASGVFGELKDSLNIIWKTQPKSGNGIWVWIRGRFFSIGMVLGVCFLLLISLVLDTVLGVVGERMGGLLSAAPLLMRLPGLAVSLAFVSVLFAMLFKYLPDRKVAWREVWPGALVTAVLFTAGKTGLELHLSKAAIASSYGAAGGLALVLVWVYYSAQIFLMGAEFTVVYASELREQAGEPAVTAKQGAPDTAGADPARHTGGADHDVAAGDPAPVPAVAAVALAEAAVRARRTERAARAALEATGNPPPITSAPESLVKVLALDKPGKLKLSQQVARLAGAGLVLAGARLLERWGRPRR